MPEGDTIARTAARLRRALAGRVLTRVAGTDPGVRAASGQLLGARVVDVRSHGKHLVVATDAGLGIRTHLGMPGSWRVYPEGAAWGRPAGAARVVLATDGTEAVCFSAPDIEVARTARLEADLTRWGPDLADPHFDLAEAVRRAGMLPDTSAAGDIVVDQRVAAGAGNVYRSEVLFMERIHPDRRLAELATAEVEGILERAHQLLQLNLTRSVRVTTGDTRRGHELWVYGRPGRPCRRCGTPIATARLGRHHRDAFWCPNCQPLTSPSTEAARN